MKAIKPPKQPNPTTNYVNLYRNGKKFGKVRLTPAGNTAFGPLQLSF